MPILSIYSLNGPNLQVIKLSSVYLLEPKYILQSQELLLPEAV